MGGNLDKKSCTQIAPLIWNFASVELKLGSSNQKGEVIRNAVSLRKCRKDHERFDTTQYNSFHLMLRDMFCDQN